MTAQLRIFMWHNVEGSWCFPCRPGAGARGIERQLRFLRSVANVVPLDEALVALSEGRSLPPRAVAITFDDGYRDNLELAVPLLLRLGLPATFFVVPGLLSGVAQPWWEVLGWAFTRARRETLVWEGERYSLQTERRRYGAYKSIAERLKRRDRTARTGALHELTELLAPAGRLGDLFLDWDGARALVTHKFTVGSHTTNHCILTEETDQSVRSELEDSKRALENELGVEIDLFAYPNGTELDYNGGTVSAVKEAGYKYALTVIREVITPESPPYELGRFLMYSKRGVKGFVNVFPPAVTAYRTLKRQRPDGGKAHRHGVHH